MARMDRNNPPDVLKRAGEHIMETYYKGACNIIRKNRRMRGVPVNDVIQTWFCIMLDSVKRCWNPDKEPLEKFIHARWWWKVYESWRVAAEMHSRRKEPLPVKTESLEDALEENGSYILCVLDKEPVFELYDEFEYFLRRIPAPYADILRDRVYLDLDFEEIRAKRELRYKDAAKLMYYEAVTMIQCLNGTSSHYKQVDLSRVLRRCLYWSMLECDLRSGYYCED